MRVDLDRDGKTDLVEMVENDRQQALRISYGGRVRPSRIVARHEGPWAAEALFAAGRYAFIVNYPETSVVVVFQIDRQLRARFIGD